MLGSPFAHAQGTDAAAFVSETTPPAEIQAGQPYPVTVTMKNTGTTTWTTGTQPANAQPSGYMLVTMNPTGGDIWNTVPGIQNPNNSVPISATGASASVGPNQTATFTFTAYAPSGGPGAYNFQWQMMHNFIRFFGDVTPNVVCTVKTDNAAFVSQVPPPSTMVAGQSYPVSVTMQNTGTSTWQNGTCQILSENLRGNQFLTPSNTQPVVGTVLPGQSTTVSFNVVAPTPGSYNFQWTMSRANIHEFGPFSTNVPVTVVAAPPALTAAATGANKITLYWSGVTGASGYNVYRSTTSGGPYALIASGAATADPGPGMVNAFMYSDTAGLVTGTEYFYVVTAVQSGTEGAQSNEASAIPDPSAIAWDSGNAALIVSQVGSMVANNLASDEPAVGELTIGGPNGVIYQSFQNGSPAQAYASPGHYSVSNRTLVYGDGNEVPAPIDTSDSDPGVPAATSSSTGLAVTAASATASLKFKQALGHAYNPTSPPSGIFREVQTQPGYSSFLSYVGLPDVMDTSLSNIDARKYHPGQPNSSIFPASDTGYIYSGGTAYTLITGKNGTTTYKSELDVGLMLFRTGDSTHPGWIPVINAPGFYFDAGFVGYPLEYDSTAANAGRCPYPPVFVSGEPLMSFKAAGFGTIPDGTVVMSFHAGTDGNVFRLVNGVRTQVGDITLVRGGLRGWNHKAQIVIKRMNSIAQNIKLSSNQPGPYAYIPPPNGPGGGFNLAGSFVKGASWGDINADDEAIDGINVFPYGQWDIGLTWQEGSYPVGNPYLGYLVQNQFFWEQYINLHT